MTTDTRYHAAVGRVALAHGHLELVQRFLIRALADLDMITALNSTEGSRISDVRKRILELARERKFPASVMSPLEALLNEARVLSKERNDLVHRAVAMDRDGRIVQKRDDQKWGPAPSITDLTTLSEKIEALAEEINEKRLTGFIRDACNDFPLPKK